MGPTHLLGLFLEQPHLLLELVTFHKQNQVGHLLRRQHLPDTIKHIIQRLPLFLYLLTELHQHLRRLLEILTVVCHPSTYLVQIGPFLRSRMHHRVGHLLDLLAPLVVLHWTVPENVYLLDSRP